MQVYSLNFFYKIKKKKEKTRLLKLLVYFYGRQDEESLGDNSIRNELGARSLEDVATRAATSRIAWKDVTRRCRNRACCNRCQPEINSPLARFRHTACASRVMSYGH